MDWFRWTVPQVVLCLAFSRLRPVDHAKIAKDLKEELVDCVINDDNGTNLLTYDCTGGEGGTPSVGCRILSQPLDATFPETYKNWV